MPFFSVVTSAYNAEEYLEKAINSVIGQTYKKFNYVIVDNGSSDNTRLIIKRYEETYPNIIRGIYVENNLGISGGRNLGIEHTTGEYVCFLDADDYWENDKLQYVADCIGSNPNINIFCHGEYHIRDDKRTPVYYRQPNNDDLYSDLLVNGNCLSTSAVIILRELLVRNHGFNEMLVSGEEDYDLWLRLANDGGRILMIDRPLGAWIIRDDSVSAKHINHTEAVVNVVNNHFERLIRQSPDKLLEKKRCKSVARLYCGCARQLSVMGDRNEAALMFKKSLENDKYYIKSYVGLLLNMLHI